MQDPPLYRFGLLALLCTGACAFSGALHAGEPVVPEPDKAAAFKPMTTRPYKEVPEVLFFETFEKQPAWIKAGKIGDDPAGPPGNHVLKLDVKDATASMKGNLALTPLKFPSGLNPKLLTVEFSIHAEDSGTVTVKFVHTKGDYSDSAPIPKAKAWGTVTMKLADMVKDKKHAAEADQLVTEIEITVKAPKNHKDPPKISIDDLIITLNAAPAEVKPRILAAEKKRLDMEKLPERDGFAFSIKASDFLREQTRALKRAKKPKAVLVMADTPQQTESLVKALSAVPKAREAGFSFAAAGGPEAGSNAIGGLADMRTLFDFNLAQNPEMALLFIGAEDALSPGRPVESVGVVIERALNAGTIPVVVLPVPDKAEQSVKVAAFSKTMQERCAQLGIPCVDATHLLKNAKGEVDKLGTQPAQDKLAALAFTALKVCHDSVAKD